MVDPPDVSEHRLALQLRRVAQFLVAKINAKSGRDGKASGMTRCGNSALGRSV
jgi:hypothetical protein